MSARVPTDIGLKVKADVNLLMLIGSTCCPYLIVGRKLFVCVAVSFGEFIGNAMTRNTSYYFIPIGFWDRF